MLLILILVCLNGQLLSSQCLLILIWVVTAGSVGSSQKSLSIHSFNISLVQVQVLVTCLLRQASQRQLINYSNQLNYNLNN